MTNAAAAANPAVKIASAKALRGEALTKVYGGRAVVDHVDVIVQPGEVAGFLGPNGAGKTTTFYMLVGLLKPDSGRIVFGGEDITTLPLYQRARRGISYLPQEPSVFRKLTVEENLLAVLETLPLTEEERRGRLQSLLDELGIAKLAKSKAGVLSGGERRRVEITRALVLDPVYRRLRPRAGGERSSGGGDGPVHVLGPAAATLAYGWLVTGLATSNVAPSALWAGWPAMKCSSLPGRSGGGPVMARRPGRARLRSRGGGRR